MTVLRGLLPLSLVDYPGHLACVAFFGHCNFRCPYCHNACLVCDPESQDEINADRLLAFLEKRRRCLTGVVFSGGEPALSPNLLRYSAEAKARGYAVKWDTNGSFPERVKEAFASGVLDAVGMDFKGPLAAYHAYCGSADQTVGARCRQTIAYCVETQRTLEMRTTVHRRLFPPETLQIMAGELRELGVMRWVWQIFSPGDILDEALLESPNYTSAELRNLAATMPIQVTLRG